MALWPRDNWYWADFTVNSRRFRIPLKDRGGNGIPVLPKRDPRFQVSYEKAIRAETLERKKAEEEQLAPRKENRARLPFNEAADQYLASRRGELEVSSLAKEGYLAARLKEYFCAKRLSQIRTADVLAYRDQRRAKGLDPASVNMEVGCLRRILKTAKLWQFVGADIKPLKEKDPDTIGRALAFEEKVRLLKTAAQKPEWETAYLAAVLAVSSTARKSELRAMQWRNVDFINRLLEIPKSKTEAGKFRVIPMTPEAFDAALRLRKRAELFGPVEAGHYVFASFRPKFRFRNRPGKRGGERLNAMTLAGFDPSRPVTSWRSAWRSLTKKAGLRGLRFHDLRHTAISVLGEHGVPDRVIMDIAGHVSQRMLKRYSHIQLEVKRTAILALSDKPRAGSGPVTSQSTSQKAASEAVSAPLSPQVIENAGRPEWTRTIDLFRVKEAL